MCLFHLIKYKQKANWGGLLDPQREFFFYKIEFPLFMSKLKKVTKRSKMVKKHFKVDLKMHCLLVSKVVFISKSALKNGTFPQLKGICF